MKEIKIVMDMEFSDEEMKEYLIGKGYRLEIHTVEDVNETHVVFDVNHLLALTDDSEICLDNEFSKVFDYVAKKSCYDFMDREFP
jgi:hypothetical protein